jgi:hypothetical protein
MISIIRHKRIITMVLQQQKSFLLYYNPNLIGEEIIRQMKTLSITAASYIRKKKEGIQQDREIRKVNEYR